MPARLLRPVVAAEMQEVRLVVPAAPLTPRPEDLPQVRLSVRMCDIEDVIFLTALVPAELAVELHLRQRRTTRSLLNDPIRMSSIETAAIAHHQRRNPQ